MANRCRPTSAVELRLLPREPLTEPKLPSTCKHKECPLYKAPPCFAKRLEELLKSRAVFGTDYPDWKHFTRYFNINIPVGEIGVVNYWASGHQNRDQHTIQCILDFAEREGHSPLLHQFEELIKVHQQRHPGHVCTTDPADCFVRCRKCVARHSLPEISRRLEPPAMSRTSSMPVPVTTDEDSEIEILPRGHEVVQASSSEPTDGQPATSRAAQEPLPGPDEVIHFLAPSLFVNEYPYKLFLGNYWILEPIIVLFLAFQTISSIFITLCEDGGAYTVFHNGLNISEFINRIITLSLRILVRVIAPFLFYRQLCSMSEAEKALEIKRKKADYTLPLSKTVHLPSHPHVTLWSIISHAVIFSVILLYLGAFLTAEGRLKKNSICIREMFRLEMPLIGLKVFAFFDCLASFFILMLVGLVKDCYCIENRLSSANDKLFEIVRKRWYRIDGFCYTVPLLVSLLSAISLYYGKAITPAPDHSLDEGQLEIWCFWMIVLTLLLFFGSATNRTAKIVTVVGNIVSLCCAFLFTVVLGVAKATFPPGSVVILLYSHLSMSTINLLYCLTKAHGRHRGIKSKRFWLNLSLLTLLSLSLLAVVIREVISLAKFVV